MKLLLLDIKLQLLDLKSQLLDIKMGNKVLKYKIGNCKK